MSKRNKSNNQIQRKPILRGMVVSAYPTPEQIKLFQNSFSNNRAVYNMALALRKRYYRIFKKTLSKSRLQRWLVKKKKNPHFSWISTSPSQAYLVTFDNLINSYKNFFEGRSKFPRFKKKYSGHKSFCSPQHVKLDVENSIVNLSKIGDVKIKITQDVPDNALVKSATVKQLPSGKYQISLLIEYIGEYYPDKTTIDKSLTVGYDLGLKTFLTGSDGSNIDNPRFMDKNFLKQLNRQNRILSRKEKLSGSWIKQKFRLARLHEKLANARKDFLHKTAYALVVKNHATTLVFESLNVKGLIRNKKLSRYIQDVSWGAFISIIEDKCDKMGKNLIQIGKFYSSSKTCSVCGNKKDKLLLSERVYSCSHCSTVIDRDYNAALNIKQEGMRLVQPLL